MSVFQELYPASFRGVPFLFASETKSGGKKTVSHEYPNSNRRFTEELGEIPPTFTIEAIIKDGLQKRYDFEAALNLEGIGTLVHPIYGILEVKSTTYSVTSNQTRVGEFKFSINFETTAPSVSPTSEGPSPADVSSKANDAQESIDKSLGESYAEPTSSSALEAAANKLDEVFSGISSQINNVINPIQENVAAFTKVTNTAQSGVLTLAQKGETVKGSLQAVYSEFLQIANSPEDAIVAWENLTTFGLADPPSPTDTFKRIQTFTNESLLNQHTRLNSLGRAYESVSYTEFTTDEQLLKFQAFLEQTYISLLQESIKEVSGAQTPQLALDADVRLSFATLRSTTQQVINEKLENVWKIVDISPGLSSMALTAYRYYGDIDNLGVLFILNQDQNVSGFSDPIKAVSK